MNRREERERGIVERWWSKEGVRSSLHASKSVMDNGDGGKSTISGGSGQRESIDSVSNKNRNKNRE